MIENIQPTPTDLPTNLTDEEKAHAVFGIISEEYDGSLRTVETFGIPFPECESKTALSKLHFLEPLATIYDLVCLGNWEELVSFILANKVYNYICMEIRSVAWENNRVKIELVAKIEILHFTLHPGDEMYDLLNEIF